MPRALLILPLASLLLAATAAGTGSGATGPPAPRVTFIADSIPAAIAYEPQAAKILARDIVLDFEYAVCRRLVGESCPYKGTRPLSLVDLLPTIDVAPTVIVGAGYNDYRDTFPETVETVLTALRKAGAERVLWLTLRVERTSYAEMNDIVRAAAARHPELTVVDWDAYSRSHPDWFQGDGLHLDYDGAVGMATLIQKTLRTLGVIRATPARLAIATRTLPPAHVGRSYRVRLTATGGVAPITWGRQAGALPAGLRLSRAGLLTGTPRSAGPSRVLIRATDADGTSVARRFALVVRTT